jgi:hypothetical protein
MNPLKTVDNLHNFNFEATNFSASDWKKKKMMLRQIFYDTPNVIDVHFALDKDTLDLYIYFDAFGMKNKPRLLKIGKLPKDYKSAIMVLAFIEVAMISMMQGETYRDLEAIKTGSTMKKMIEFYKDGYSN